LLEDEPVELGARRRRGATEDELLPLGLELDDDDVLSVEVELDPEVDGTLLRASWASCSATRTASSDRPDAHQRGPCESRCRRSAGRG
jgi:hypothetical protein